MGRHGGSVAARSRDGAGAARAGCVTLRAVEAAPPHVRRVARAGVLALCDRLERAPGTSLYAEGKARFETAEERVEITPPFRVRALGERRPHRHRRRCARTSTQPRRVGLLVVRLGGYGAGVYEDEQLVSGKHGVRFVKNRNKKGGSSSNRFRRRRGEQARDAYDRACALAEEILAPHAPALDEFVLAGDRIGLEQVIERSRLLTGLTRARADAPRSTCPRCAARCSRGSGRELWSSTRRADASGRAGRPRYRRPPARSARRTRGSSSATRSAHGLAVHREHVLGVLLARARVVVGAGERPVVADDELRVQEVVHGVRAPRDAALAAEVRLGGDEAEGRGLPRRLRQRRPTGAARPASACDRRRP